MSTLPNNRTAAIADTIAQVFNSYVTDRDNVAETQKEFMGLAKAASASREDTLATLAGTAIKDNWSPGELESAITAAKQRRNAKDASLNTFANEISTACAPKVRPHVAGIVGLVRELWEGEAEGDDKPMRKAFQRRYHAIVRFCGEAEKGNILATPEDAVNFARKHDPDADPDKVHARLRKIEDMLASFARDFPVSGLTECVKFLHTVTKADLAECRPTQPRPMVEPDNTPDDIETDDGDVAEGASDILDEALADARA